MVQIKSFDREIQAQNIGSQYVDGGNTRGAFGEDVATANVNLQNAGLSMFATTQKIQEQRERTKALQLKNAIYNEWEHPKLYSQDGYYNMLGQNASGAN